MLQHWDYFRERFLENVASSLARKLHEGRPELRMNISGKIRTDIFVEPLPAMASTPNDVLHTYVKDWG